MKYPKAVTELVSEVEALCKIYVGENAESEQWGDTCRRLERLDKLVKRARKALDKLELDRRVA